MDSQYQELSAQSLIARDGPKYSIDPAFVLFFRESPSWSIVTVFFCCCLFASKKASKPGQRNIRVLLQGGMVASNLTLIILLGRQWYSYHRAFLALDEEMPNQIYIPVHVALYLGILFSCLILGVVVLIFLGLWRPRIILRKSRLDEEARHSYSGTDYNPELYNQPFISWINQFSLTCTWIITCVSMQAKLPGAAYANMLDAHLFPRSWFELSLNVLANAHLYLGIVGWIILSFVVFQFGKSLVLFRLDVTTRCKRFWRIFKAQYEVELANQWALRASREGTVRAASWPSSYSSSPSNTPASSSLDRTAADTDRDTHIEMETARATSWPSSYPSSSSNTPQASSLDRITADSDRNTHIEMEETWSTTTLNESREEWGRPVVNLPFWGTGYDGLGVLQSGRLRN